MKPERTIEAMYSTTEEDKALHDRFEAALQKVITMLAKAGEPTEAKVLHYMRHGYVQLFRDFATMLGEKVLMGDIADQLEAFKRKAKAVKRPARAKAAKPKVAQRA
jgi:hypothetical protein